MKIMNLVWTILIGFSILNCSSDEGSAPPPTTKEDVVQKDAAIIDLNDEKQIIRGFGSSTAFRLDFPLSDTDMDILFGNNEGQLGFSIHRIRLVPDDNATDRQIELNHALGAKNRGAIVVASPWSPPVRMKTNSNLIGGELKEESYAEYATYLNDFALYMENEGVPLYSISVQNEPDIQVDYESCDWSPSQMLNFIVDHGDKITATKLMAPESFQFRKIMSDPILNNEVAAANVDIIGGHIYGGGLTDYPIARNKGKEVWMTEHLDTEITWDAVFATGKEIHDCMTIGNFSAYIWWYSKRFYGPLDEDGTVSKRGYIMSNYTKFIRPGYHRIEASNNPKSNIYVSAYYNGSKTVIVALNTGTASIKQQFAFENGSVSSVTPYVTSQSKNLEKEASIEVSASINAFSYTLPAQSIVTFEQD